MKLTNHVSDKLPEEMKAEIETSGDGCYFDSRFAQWIAANYDVYTEDAIKMIRAEAKARIEDGMEKGRDKDGRAQKAACACIFGWLTEASEYSVNTESLKDLASFVCSHRIACVWSVLVGKAKAGTV